MTQKPFKKGDTVFLNPGRCVEFDPDPMCWSDEARRLASSEAVNERFGPFKVKEIHWDGYNRKWFVTVLTDKDPDPDDKLLKAACPRGCLPFDLPIYVERQLFSHMNRFEMPAAWYHKA